MIWAYSGKTQSTFADDAGITPRSRLKDALSNPRHTPPTTDELRAWARVAGVPETFAIYGWQRDLEARVNAIEAVVRTIALEQLEEELERFQAPRQLPGSDSGEGGRGQGGEDL